MLRASSRLSLAAAVAFLLAAPAAMHAQIAIQTGTWATSPVAAKAGAAGKVDETFREIVHVSLGSTDGVSITLTNEFGTEPLIIGAASIGLHTTADGVQGTVPVTFHGQPTVTIPPGTAVQSDAVRLQFPARSDVAVSLFIPAQLISTLSQHNFANATNYIAPGNQVTALTLDQPKPYASWRFLKGVSVTTSGTTSIVCLGDSITDGSKSTANTNQRWPDLLAARLGAPGSKVPMFGVLNEGIGGNRILHDVTGPSAIERFDRDVLGSNIPGEHGIRYLIILEGINDIGHAADPVKPYDVVSADELIAAYHLLAVRAHANHLKVIGATLTPYGGAKYASPAGEAIRSALNNWIRTTKELDGVIDFDKAARDPANPAMFLPAYDSGDHLHPTDAGMKAMADSIDLSLFTK